MIDKEQNNNLISICRKIVHLPLVVHRHSLKNSPPLCSRKVCSSTFSACSFRTFLHSGTAVRSCTLPWKQRLVFECSSSAHVAWLVAQVAVTKHVQFDSARQTEKHTCTAGCVLQLLLKFTIVFVQLVVFHGGFLPLAFLFNFFLPASLHTLQW